MNSSRFHFSMIFWLCLLNLPLSARAYSLPTEQSYEEDGKLMVNICSKFAEETDPAKLHKAAVNTQYARVVSCSDYNEECSLYGTFLTLAIHISQDGDITPAERIQMRDHLDHLKKALAAGKSKLHRQWAERNKASAGSH